MGFQKKLPKNITFYNYKKFDNAKFLYDVNNFALDQFDVTSFKKTIFKFKFFEQMKALL